MLINLAQTLPKLLLSATHLVRLYLCDIPHYISLEAMATCLSNFHDQLRKTSTCFRTLSILSRPQKPTSISANALCPPHSHEYLEESVARIDSPQLFRLSTTFFNDLRAPELNQLNQFISRTPTLGQYDEAHLTFCSLKAPVGLRLRQYYPELSGHRMVEVKISGQVSDH